MALIRKGARPDRPNRKRRGRLPFAATALVGTLLLAGCATPSGSIATAIAQGQRAVNAVEQATGRSTQAGASSSAAAQAIQAVIRQANAEQQQAYAEHNPAVMQATATAAYAAQLDQTQQQLQNAGVTAIKLVSLQWGPVSVQGTSAQATTVETWQTTFADGSTQQDRARNVYTLVRQGNAWKVAADVQPATQVDQTPGQSPLPSIPLPGVSPTLPGVPGAVTAPTQPATPDTIGQSANWAGYAATGGTYTAVSGTWKVPTVAASGTPGADATWVGIGGVTSTDLIQAGTQATAEGGSVRYSAWVETLPQASQTVPLAVSPGDTVSVSIAQQSGGAWLTTFNDATSGQSYQTTETYASSRSSAEWVEEAPAGGRYVLPLDQFDSVQFTAGSTVKDGKQDTIAQAGGQAITMVSAGGQTLAKPAALGGNGSSFSVAEAATPPQATAPGYGRRGRPFPGGGFGGSAPFGRGV